MKYSQGFRNSVLRKVLPPENRNVYAVAREVGISPQTVQRWLSKLKEGTLSFDYESSEPTPSEREAVEKFKLLLEAQKISEEEKGAWLRERGLHTEHLALYEQELEDIVKDRQQAIKQEIKELKKENRNLKRELARKEKAMAEALALLTLKKKADLLFSLPEDP